MIELIARLVLDNIRLRQELTSSRQEHLKTQEKLTVATAESAVRKGVMNLYDLALTMIETMLGTNGRGLAETYARIASLVRLEAEPGRLW